MAVIIEIPFNLNSVDFGHETHTRTPGLHVSNIIRSIQEDVFGMFKGDGLESDALENYRTAGFLFERALYDVILKDEEVVRLGEFEVDGIIMTPDAVNITRGRGIESKCTWRSMKHNPTDTTGEFREWHQQMMSYAKGLSIYDWDLWAFFINGSYGKDRRPQLKHYEIEYEEEEVEANWKMIKNHGIWMRQQGKA